MSQPSLIDYAQALDLVLHHAPTPQVEVAPLKQLGGRVLAEPIIALRDHPAFTASAVDGFAISETDRERLRGEPIELLVKATLGPGESSDGISVEHGCAIHVLTGACIPAGTAAVVMQEQAELRGSALTLHGPAALGDHIRLQAEEFRLGDLIVPAGVFAHSGVIAAAAMTGKAEWQVGAVPRVALLVTGDELFPPGSEAAEHAVFDTHTYALGAALREIGIEPVHTARSADTGIATTLAMREALGAATVVITTGGVSGGERDYVRRAMATCGVVEVFAGVRMKPGRPAVFGVTRAAAPQYVFGLPGNPMAALIAFATLVKPFLLKASGVAHPKPQLLPATLATEVHKRPGVTEFVPVMLQGVGGGLVAVPLQGRRSHMFGGLAMANGLAMLPEDSELIPAGGKIPVLRWGVA